MNDDSMKDLVEPVFRALIKSGLTIQQAYRLLFPLAHESLEGRNWIDQLSEIKDELEIEQETKIILDRLNKATKGE